MADSCCEGRAAADSADNDAMTDTAEKSTPGVKLQPIEDPPTSVADDRWRDVEAPPAAAGTWLWGYIGLCVLHPRKVCLTIALLMLVVGGWGTTFMTPADNHPENWSISEENIVEQTDAYTAALNLVAQQNKLTPRSERSKEEMITLLFDWSDGRSASIFTPENVQHMCEMENLILNANGWEDWCQLDPKNTSQCAEQTNLVTNNFYPSSSFIHNGALKPYRSCALLSKADTDKGAAALYKKASNQTTAASVGFWLANDTPKKGFSVRSRTFIDIGGPLKGYSSMSVSRVEQQKEYQSYIDKNVKSNLFNKFGLESTFGSSAYYDAKTIGSLEVAWMSRALMNIEFEALIAADMSFAIFAIVFVLFYIWFHTGSFVIASFAMFIIVFSLPLAALFMRICQVVYFDTLQVLAIFLCLGIGADDIFVFMDAFVSARKMENKSLQWMLWFTVIHTRQAVFNTSFTTTIAFLACGVSPLMPIQVFGYYAASAICIVYALVLTFIPPALVVYLECCSRCHTCFCLSTCDTKCPPQERLPLRPEPGCSCCCTASPDEVMPMEPSSPEPSTNEPSNGATNDAGGVAEATNAPSSGAGESEVAAPSAMLKIDESGKPTFMPYLDLVEKHPHLIESLGCMQRMLVQKYVPCMRYEIKGFKVVAMVCVALFAVLFGVLASYAFQMEQPTSAEQWFPSRHMWATILDDLANNYMQGTVDAYVSVDVVFGITGIDRSGFNRYIPHKDRGSAVFDGDFSTAIETAAAHTALLAACKTIDTYKCGVSGCKMPTLAYPGSTKCFIEDFRNWNNGTIPTGAQFSTKLKQFRTAFTGNRFDQQYNYMDRIGFVDGKVKFIALSFHTSLLALQPYTVTKDVYDTTEAMISSIAKTMPTGLRHTLDVSGEGEWGRSWDYLTVQKALVDGLFQGFAICFPASFVVLLFATRNVITALIAIVSMAGIVACVLGFVHGALDYSLGIVETIAAVCVIGFSVDYTVHMAHMYHETDASSAGSRTERASFAVVHMGATVFGGAVTTMGAGIMLLFCVMMFFVKMGTIMVATIFFSYCYAMFFFMPLLFVAGPEGAFGSLDPLVEAIRARCCADNSTNAQPAVEMTEIKSEETPNANAPAPDVVVHTEGAAS